VVVGRGGGGVVAGFESSGTVCSNVRAERLTALRCWPLYRHRSHTERTFGSRDEKDRPDFAHDRDRDRGAGAWAGIRRMPACHSSKGWLIESVETDERPVIDRSVRSVGRTWHPR